MLRHIVIFILLTAFPISPLRADILHWETNHPANITVEIDLFVKQPQLLTDDLIVNILLSYPKGYETKANEIQSHLLDSFVLLDKPALRLVEYKQIDSTEQHDQIIEKWTFCIAPETAGIVPLSLFALHFTLPGQTKQIAIALPVFMLEVVETTAADKKNEQKQKDFFSLSLLTLCLIAVGLCIFLMVLLYRPFLHVKKTVYIKLMYKKKQWQLQAINRRYSSKNDLDNFYFSLLKFIANEIEQHLPSFPAGHMAMPFLRAWLIASEHAAVVLINFDTFVEQREKIQYGKLTISPAHCNIAFLLAKDLLRIFYQSK